MIRKATLLAVLSAALLAPTAVTAPSTAAASPVTAGRQTVKLTVDAITPDVPREPTTEINISGTVTNAGAAALSGLRVRIRYTSVPFPDRASLEAYQTCQACDQASRSIVAEIPAINAGGKAQWELPPVTPAYLNLSGFGVYPLSVEVLDANWQPIAIQRTYLTYAPSTMPKLPRTRLAFALPIIDQPHRSVDATFIDDQLRTSLVGTGRLADLLKIARSKPKNVTWFVEPALLDDVDAMTRPHRVKTRKTSQDRPADASAAQWLESLRSALATASVVATPYADPDVVALAHQGLDAQTGKAVSIGAEQARKLLQRDVPTNVNWPVGGLIDADGLDLLAVSKVDTVLLNAENAPPQPPVLTTPDAATTVDSVMGPVTALVADPGLSRALELDPSFQGSSVMARQRFVAETAMIAKEQPPTAPARSLLVAPSRRWQPNPEHVTALLKTTAGLPWLANGPVTALKAGKAGVPRAALTYTELNRKAELGKKYLDGVAKLAGKSQLTTEITSKPLLSAFDRSVLRLTSSAWRGRTGAATSSAKQVNATTDEHIGKVQVTGISSDKPRSIAGTEASIPISVRNGLKQDVTLKVAVTSDNRELLTIGSYDEQMPLTITAEQNGTVVIPMKATTSRSGDALVTVQLTTLDGKNYGPAQKLTVRTTGYTGIALVIVGGGLVVMLAAVVMRVLRRRSQKRVARATKTRESEHV